MLRGLGRSGCIYEISGGDGISRQRRRVGTSASHNALEGRRVHPTPAAPTHREHHHFAGNAKHRP